MTWALAPDLRHRLRAIAGVAASASSLLAAGCAGGSPLLHPARTLPAGDVRAASGFSSVVALGGHADALREARDVAARPTSPASAETFARGALVAAALAPGIAPFVAARVGLGSSYEGGLAYTGRGARVDARRSFELGEGWSLSAGVGGSALFYGRAQGGQLPDVDLASLHGYGADVPLLAGWESDAGIYRAWLGARAGYEHTTIATITSEPKSGSLVATPIGLSADRFYAGGVFGLAAGFRRVHVAIELAVAYETMSGTFGASKASVSGPSATPATAAWFTF